MSIESESGEVADKNISPAKALFHGSIVKSLFWPFPEINSETEEMLRMVLDSVDHFLEGRQDEFDKRLASLLRKTAADSQFGFGIESYY